MNNSLHKSQIYMYILFISFFSRFLSICEHLKYEHNNSGQSFVIRVTRRNASNKKKKQIKKKGNYECKYHNT